MKKSFFIGLCALMAATMISCSNKQEVNNPANQQTPEQKVLPCAVYVGDCGDQPDWSKPMGIPARVSNNEPLAYDTPESLLADRMGENQLRIIWMKIDQCEPKFDINATLTDQTITLTCQDTAYMVTDCECLFPLYFDFDSLAYGLYTIIAGDVEHHIDFQEDMEQYEYEYE